MLSRLLIFLFLVAGISFGVDWLFRNDGAVQFLWLGYQVKTTISFFIIGVFIFLVWVLLMVQVLLSLFRLPKTFKRSYRNRQLEQSLISLQKGYAALLSNDLSQAQKNADHLIGLNSRNENIKKLSFMLAAKVADEKGNPQLAEGYYDKLSSNKNYRFFATKGKLNAAFAQGKIDEAILHAEDAYRQKPNVENGAHSLLELYKKAGYLNKAEAFLKKYERRHLFFKDKANYINIKNELGEIYYARAVEIYEHAEGIKSNYSKAYKFLEKSLEVDPYNIDKLILMMHICRHLGYERKAQQLIEYAWVKVQSYELGASYLNVYHGNDYQKSAKQRLKALEELAKLAAVPEIIQRLKDKVYDPQIEF